jgi:Spy/CpxP family protein refolding chaperone
MSLIHTQGRNRMTINVNYARGDGGITLTQAQRDQLQALRDTQEAQFNARKDTPGLGTAMYQLLLSFRIKWDGGN